VERKGKGPVVIADGGKDGDKESSLDSSILIHYRTVLLTILIKNF